MTFEEYVQALYQDIPTDVCVGLLAVLCLGVVAKIGFYGWKHGWRKIAGLVLVEYVFLIYSSTVFFRDVRVDRRYDFTPFWSYRAIEQGQIQLLPENIMNVIAFVPVGLLIGVGSAKWSWWNVHGLGCLISISIETMQYIFKCGFSEVDDVMHNTLGCAIGFGVIKLIMFAHSAFRKAK